MKQQGSSCEFCSEMLTGLIPPHYHQHIGATRRILRERVHLVTMPTISPLAPNHILVIPRRHVTSILQLGAIELDGIFAEVREAGSKLSADGLRTVRFEHGIGADAIGGCGIAHAHVHLVPLQESVVDDLVCKFWSTELHKLNEVSVNSSYITLGDVEDPVWLARIGEFPSQYLRNLVEQALGLARTSWRDLVRNSWLTDTLADARWAFK